MGPGAAGRRVRRPHRLPRLGTPPGPGRLAALLRAGGPRWCAAGARLARPGDPARNPGLPLTAGRFRLRHAGPGQRCHHPGRHTRTAGGLAAGRGARREDRRLRAERARGRLRRGGHAHARHAGGRWLASGRQQNLDQQRWPGRLLPHLRQDRPGRRRTRHQCLHRRRRRARPGQQRPYRGDGAAPAGHAALRRLPARGRRPGRPGQRRFQAGHADAGHLPCLGGRRRAGHGPACLRRGGGAHAAAPPVRPDAGRLPAHAGAPGRDECPHRCGGHAHLPRRLAARLQHHAGRGHPGLHGRRRQRQAHRDRERPEGHRHGAADVRWPRRARRRGRRAPVPRHPCAAHLRRRQRGATADSGQTRPEGRPGRTP